MKATRKNGVRAVNAALLATVVAACGPLDDGEQIGTQQSALNGTVNFDGSCNAAQRTLIQQAFNRLVTQLRPRDHRLKNRLKDAFTSMDRDHSPEQIIRELREDMPTQVSCVNSTQVRCGGSFAWNGCAPVGINNEQIQISFNALATMTVARLASVVLHEVAHNKGFSHLTTADFDYDFTINEQVEACSLRSSPNGVDRSDVAGETSLALSGGGAGRPFELSCGKDRWAVGTTVTTGPIYGLQWAPRVIQKLELRCRSLTGGTTIVRSVGSAVGVGRTVNSRQCASGSFVSGLYGRADSRVNYLSQRCGSLSALRAGSRSATTQTVGGVSRGDRFDRICPAGMAIKRLSGRAGAAIDQLRVVCQEVDVERGDFRKLARVGTESGKHHDHRCVGFGALVGLYGNSGQIIDRLGGICRPLIADSSGNLTINFRAEHPLPVAGGGGGTGFTDRCPGGSAIVGLRMRQAKRVHRVQAICAPVNQWHYGIAGTLLTDDTPHGGNGGTQTSRMCSRGEFVAGWETWAGTGPSGSASRSAFGLNGLRPICRALGRVKLPPKGIGGSCDTNADCLITLRCRPTSVVQTTGAVLARACHTPGGQGALCDESRDCQSVNKPGGSISVCSGLSSSRQFGTCRSLGPVPVPPAPPRFSPLL